MPSGAATSSLMKSGSLRRYASTYADASATNSHHLLSAERLDGRPALRRQRRRPARQRNPTRSTARRPRAGRLPAPRPDARSGPRRSALRTARVWMPGSPIAAAVDIGCHATRVRGHVQRVAAAAVGVQRDAGDRDGAAQVIDDMAVRRRKQRRQIRARRIAGRRRDAVGQPGDVRDAGRARSAACRAAARLRARAGRRCRSPDRCTRPRP